MSQGGLVRVLGWGSFLAGSPEVEDRLQESHLGKEAHLGPRFKSYLLLAANLSISLRYFIIVVVIIIVVFLRQDLLCSSGWL